MNSLEQNRSLNQVTCGSCKNTFQIDLGSNYLNTFYCPECHISFVDNAQLNGEVAIEFQKSIFSFLKKIEKEYRGVKTKSKTSSTCSPILSMKGKKIPSLDFAYDLIAISPEFIFGKIGFHLKKYKDQIEVWNPDNHLVFSQVKGILNCHALSPMGDTIFLLADLGRSMRISSVLNKPMTILLADKDWSEYNWVASDLGNQNLIKNFGWRKDLYSKIGVNFVDECNLDNTNVNGITKNSIESEGNDYEDLVRCIYGSDYIGRKLDTDEREYLINNYKLHSNNEAKMDVLRIPIIKEGLKLQKEVVLNLLSSLKRFDQKTFIYYFTQRYHQFKYKDYLKVAVRSEKNFDIPFYNLDKNEEYKGVNFSLYFENYKMSENKFAIPYYFPSGSLYENKDELHEYISKTIMLDDSNDKEKVIKCFKEMNYPYNARLVSDIMSFAHFLAFPLNNSQKQKGSREKFKNCSHLISSEFNNSWRFYAVSPLDFRKRVTTWSQSIFTAELLKVMKLPYFIFPHIELFGDQNKDKYAEYLAEMLEIIVNVTSFPNYHEG